MSTNGDSEPIRVAATLLPADWNDRGRREVVRKRGVALFKYGKRRGGADVIFGEKGDSTLLGVLSLEALGFLLDPIRGELKPLPMLMSLTPSAR
jgi:hypothetical protein